MLAVLRGLIVLFAFSMQMEASCCKTLPTYFCYNADNLRGLCEEESTSQMSADEIKKWDEIVSSLNKQNSIGSNIYRLYAYLSTAQRDAAFLSHNLHGCFRGSLDPISFEVVKLFFPNAEHSEKEDGYSTKLAAVVMAKIQERFKREKEGIREFPATRGDMRLRDFPRPYGGLERASWMPWILQKPAAFLLPEPKKIGDSYWKEQAKMVQKVVEEVTQEQKDEVMFWSGKLGPGSGEWRKFASDYMEKQHTDFDEMVFIRSVMAQAGVDTDIVVYLTKYTYIMPRPWMVNPAIVPLTDKAHHPSYPSGHATLSAMYAVILTNFFPANEVEWYRLARDAALSRVWSGLHFPIDTWEGRKLGIRLGQEVVHSLRNQCF